MDKKTIWKNHHPDTGHHPDRHWNYAGRHQLHDVALRCMLTTQTLNETPAASEKNEGRVI